MKRTFFRSVLSLVAVLATACSDDVTARGTEPTVPISAQVASVEVSPVTVLLTVGDTVRLVATPRDAGGAPLLGRAVEWTSETPSAAAVTSDGLVTALTAGYVRVSANSEGRTGFAQLTLQK